MKRLNDPSTMAEQEEESSSNDMPKKSRIGGEGSWLLKLPPNIFNVIVGLLDSRSLVDLADSNDQLWDMVYESEKHWKDVFISGDCFCIDYECYGEMDAGLLIDNAKIDNYKKDEAVPDARGLTEFPTELTRIILEPLAFGSLLQVEGCHEKLNAIGHSIPIDFVNHRRNAINKAVEGLDPIWEVNPDPLVNGFLSLMDAVNPSDVAILAKWYGLAPEGDDEDDDDEEEEPPINAAYFIDYLKSNSLLDGRHVRDLLFDGVHPRHAAASKVKPKFTCDNFFYLSEDEDCYLDKEILQDILKPKNVWSARLMEGMFGPDFPRGTLTFGMLDPCDYVMAELHAPRLHFKSDGWGDDHLWLCGTYIDEWLAGSREIEAIWIRTFPKYVWEDDEEEEDEDYSQERFKRQQRECQNGLVKKYGWLTFHSENVVKGQMARDDGKMLEVRVGFYHIVLQTAGSSIRFLECDNHYKDVPEF